MAGKVYARSSALMNLQRSVCRAPAGNLTARYHSGALLLPGPARGASRNRWPFTMVSLVLLSTLAATSFASDGDFDESFGSGGFAPVSAAVAASAATPDGGIILAEINATPDADPDVRVSKLDSTGQADVSFGEAGSRLFNPGLGPERVQDVAVDAAGNVFVVGTTGEDPDAFTYVTKLTAAGSVDQSYGNGGTGDAAISNLVQPLVARVQADGKLVVAAVQGIVFRMTIDGVRDIDSFSPRRGIIDLPDEIGATGLAIDSAGRLLVSGYLPALRADSPSQIFRVLRLLPDGSQDPAFGVGGRVDLALGDSINTSLSTDVVVDELDRVYVAGIYQSGPFSARVSGSALLRLQTNGEVDPSFGEAGITWVDIPERSTELLQQMVRRQDGRILLGGDALGPTSGASCPRPPRYEFFVVAILPDGRLDETFGLGGWQEGQASAPSACFQAVNYSAQPTLELTRLADQRVAGRGGAFSFAGLGVLTTDPPGNVSVFYDAEAWIAEVEPGSLLNFEGFAEPDDFVFVGWPGRFEQFGVTIQNNSQLFVQNTNAYGTGAFLSPQGADPQIVDFTFPAGTRAFSLLASSGSAVPTITVNGAGPYTIFTVPGALSFFAVTNDELIRTARITVPGSGIDLDLVAVSSGLVAEAPDADVDGDGIVNAADNCLRDANADQADEDSDGNGNACDADDDGDGMSDAYELDNGLDALDAADALLDRDGDGFSNLAESQDGSDAQSRDSVPAPAGADSRIAASLLPTSRSVTVGGTATVLATMVNADPGTALSGCSIAPLAPLAASFYYAATDPSTNAVIGERNRTVSIPPGGSRSFLIAFTPSAVFPPGDLELRFDCANSPPAAVLPGINTLLLAGSSAPTPDIITLAATVSGVLDLPAPSNAGAFAIASANLGSAGPLEVSADDGGADLGLAVALCQTNPDTGVCVNPETPTAGPLSVFIPENGTPTFSVFVTGSSSVPFDPARNRVYVRFAEPDGAAVRGSTSVAVRSVD